MNLNKQLLIIGVCLVCFSSIAQMPPMPPYPITATNDFVPGKILKSKTYKCFCVSCKKVCRNLTLSAIISTKTDVLNETNCVIITIRSLNCSDYNHSFIAKTVETNEIPVAVEETTEPLMLPGIPFGSLGPTTWTTNANLKLNIRIINKGSNSIMTTIPSGIVSNTITLVAGSIPIAAISFPTELGKSYACQRTDDGKQTWKSGVTIPGTGQYATNYELLANPASMYRVLEMQQ